LHHQGLHFADRGFPAYKYGMRHDGMADVQLAISGMAAIAWALV
jgi:hypothetical protein